MVEHLAIEPAVQGAAKFLRERRHHRVEVARGPAISQAGDWFGRPVNLASRITEVARPDSVLADAAAIEAAGDAFSYSKASEHKFKGVKKAVKLYRVRREPRKGRKEKKSEATAESA